MDKYRICKNKYGWYKIQMRKPDKKFLWHTIKSKWEDACFDIDSKICVRFQEKKEAQKQILKFIMDDKKLNNEWKC